ncbi:MAG: Choline-sulfatase [uncultured Thermomicrobiales bacterium]|uniref:Choline-sulfatase n=1 Tax=uncultured Thermomicrobiales bacterium TaxID=1645740 RepID=A0A6J4UT66_9BACT|nr:MAG: Choline-sulfatase [uncultured Thermomicrobiales bacterium]
MKSSHLALLLAMLALPTPRSGAAEARPNILFFFADDWGRVASCYADPARPSINDVVRTPNVDRVAREGVRFANAFVGCPQCTPSRGTVLTGSHFWRLGSAANLEGGAWKGVVNPFDALPRFSTGLVASGYHLDKQHKTLALESSKGTGRFAGPPIGEFLRYGLHVAPGRDRADHDRRHAEVVDQTRRTILRVLADRPGGRPFFFVFGPINAHRPYAPGSGRLLWGIDPDALVGRLPAFLPDVPEVRDDVADYLGEVQALDLMLGIFLEELTKAGLLDDTMVVLAGDNGVPGLPRGKTQMYDLGTATPLVVRWPGRVRPGRTVDDLVSLIDLAPTFLEVARATPSPAMDGRSLLPLLTSDRSGVIDPTRDHVVFGRERHFGTARPGNLPYPSRAIRTRDFLYVRNFKPDRWPMGDPFGISPASAPDADQVRDRTVATLRDLDASPTKAWLVAHRDEPGGRRFYDLAVARRPAEELYDLRADPDQVRDLAADPGQADPIRDLSARLLRTMAATRDPRLDDAFDRPPYVDPPAVVPAGLMP